MSFLLQILKVENQKIRIFDDEIKSSDLKIKLNNGSNHLAHSVISGITIYSKQNVL